MLEEGEGGRTEAAAGSVHLLVCGGGTAVQAPGGIALHVSSRAVYEEVVGLGITTLFVSRRERSMYC